VALRKRRNQAYDLFSKEAKTTELYTWEGTEKMGNLHKGREGKRFGLVEALQQVTTGMEGGVKKGGLKEKKEHPRSAGERARKKMEKLPLKSWGGGGGGTRVWMGLVRVHSLRLKGPRGNKCSKWPTILVSCHQKRDEFYLKKKRNHGDRRRKLAQGEGKGVAGGTRRVDMGP